MEPTAKMKATAVDLEAAARKMANIFDLNVDVILHILRFLRIQDRIAFVFTCERFRRLCVDEAVFRRIDLSRCALVKMQRCAISRFFRDKQIAQQITELNISNVRVFNWQMDDQLEQFVISICPHLKALHVMNCGMSLQMLHCILQKAPRLTSLSWSLWDITSEDVEFVFKSIESQSQQMTTTNSMMFSRKMSSDVKPSDVICLNNIKQLHLEIFHSTPHIQILKYLVLSCCKDIERLQIYTWQAHKDYYIRQMIPLEANQTIPGFPQQFTSVGPFQHLHSLTVVTMGNRYLSSQYSEELCNFISSVVRKKLRETSWKKLWISPEVGISSLQVLIPSLNDHPHEIQPDELLSVEEISAHANWPLDEMDKLRTLLQSIGDNTVRSMHLHQCMFESNSTLELCDAISRVGGHALKFLNLSDRYGHEIEAQTNVVFHTLFSNCSNVTELGLLDCCFERDICKPLSNLRHLTKVQLNQCAISSKYDENEVEISKADLLTFVESCKNITHLDVRCCGIAHKHFSCRLTDDDLLALAKLSNLKSLTLRCIFGITEWTFLKSISENCKLLSMLRIAATSYYFNNYHILILMESAKFVKHLAILMEQLDLQSEDFWNLLSQAKNLERLCIKCTYRGLINVPVAVETLKSLPRLHVLHLHFNYNIENINVFRNQIKRMLEEENSDRSSFFELVTEYLQNYSWKRQVFKKALPINEAELCNMTSILEIPRF